MWTQEQFSVPFLRNPGALWIIERESFWGGMCSQQTLGNRTDSCICLAIWHWTYIRKNSKFLTFILGKICTFSSVEAGKKRGKKGKRNRKLYLVYVLDMVDTGKLLARPNFSQSTQLGSFFLSPLQLNVIMWLCSRKQNVNRSVLCFFRDLTTCQAWFCNCFPFQLAGMEAIQSVTSKAMW